MKTFKFNKKDNAKIINAMITHGYNCDNEVMALTKIAKYYGNKTNLYVYKNYKDEYTYVMYENSKSILRFVNEEETYKFILTY